MSYGQPSPYQPYAPQPPTRAPQPNRVRNGCLIAAGCVAGLIVLLIIIGAVLSAANKPTHNGAASQPASTPSTGSTPGTSATTRAKPAAAAKVLATFSGTGIENTPKFTVSGTWKLEWRYNCSAFGSQGNFAVLTDGGNDPAGADVNELGNGGHGTTYAYGDSGRHYLAVDSECAWRVKVVGTR